MSSLFQPRGHRGSWFAEWQGKSYPCIHNHWRRGRLHDDPYAIPGVPKWDEFIAAILEGKVIETRDIVPQDLKDGAWIRDGYIALWEIDNIEVTPNTACQGCSHLRFHFARRLAG
jgi:hypothetical protein